MKNILFGLLTLGTLLLSSCEKEATLSENMEETFYLRSDGADMPVFVRGNGASKVFILILHGGPGGNGLEYRSAPYSDLLEKKYGIVYWDQRIQGNSHGHLSKEDITIDNMVEDTYALIKTLKSRYGSDISVFLLGHSWGGMLGTSYLIKNDYQNELKGWIEVDGAHDFPLHTKEAITMIQTLGAQEIAAGNNVAKWQEMIDYVNPLDPDNLADEQVAKINQFGRDAEPLLSQIQKGDNAIGIFELFSHPNNFITSAVNGLQLPQSFLKEVISNSLTSELNKITIPTLIQWGRYDVVIPPALATSAYNNIGSSDKYLKVYENSGHSPMINEPEKFAQDIIDFVDTYK